MTLNVLGAARANDSLRAQPPLTGRLGKGGEAQVGGTGGGFQRQRSGQFVYANRIAERRSTGSKRPEEQKSRFSTRSPVRKRWPGSGIIL